ncbi:MAG: hypothetical protein BZ137_02565 [Methanosphaera sp. rholeuAM130]|nr:hypothetical protein [Methanosphaera sp.]RAP54370.1 MAG: hypothetical protein BZ137_02565 [Methanosphaera sp. rholeuAM130]
MQKCEKCGQYNYNYEERCVYCGEFFYIAVNHDDGYTHTPKHHDFTDDIIDELSNSNNEATEYMDIDDNPFTKTIEKNSYHEDARYINDDYIDGSFINEGDGNFHDLEVNEAKLPDEAIFEEERNVNPPKKQHIIDLQNDLKRKIKRNKKLENSIGIMFSDIDVDITSIKNPIEISGRAHFNQNEMHEEYKLSIICYDVLQNKLDRREVILENNDNTEHVDFSVSIHPNIHKTAMIILLPEIIQKDTFDDISGQSDDFMDVEIPRNLSNQIFIENMTDIERKIGMKIDNTSILLKSDRKIEVVGEIYIKDPDRYSTIMITGTCYDKNNHIIATESTRINTRLYLGFDTLRLIINDVDVNRIQRIKIYPTLQGLE